MKYMADHTLPPDETFDGSRYWLNNGKLHREQDKPAFVGPTGTREWWIHGRRHREGGKPAYIGPSGTLMWWKDGHICRDDNKPGFVKANGWQEVRRAGNVVHSRFVTDFREQQLRYNFVLTVLLL